MLGIPYTPIMGSDIFAKCKSLENIELPCTVTNIDSKAFADCISLKTVILYSRTEISPNAFKNCNILYIGAKQ